MKDNLENLFKNLENQFDIEEPNIGHFNRFESKLNAKKTGSSRSKIIKFISGIAAAAAVILFVGVWIGSNFSTRGIELASVSTEMAETQSYFVSTIQKELATIENERTKDTEIIINDGLEQLKKLETQYQSLTLELKESAEDKRVIYAMISNFQQRIEVLQSLLIQIENVKQLKTENNENYV
jgi:septal ring factor EnvC (AmiA/AmiB activator)